jgi:hypothetical protein
MDLDIFVYLLIAAIVILTEVYEYRIIEKRMSRMDKRLDKVDIVINDIKCSMSDLVKMTEAKLKEYQSKVTSSDIKLRDYQIKMREDKIYNETNRKYIIEIQDKIKDLNSRIIVIETVKPPRKDLYSDYRDPVTRRLKGSKNG